jgi:hypothetical protein
MVAKKTFPAQIDALRICRKHGFDQDGVIFASSDTFVRGNPNHSICILHGI